jgi:hypothetical protein
VYQPAPLRLRASTASPGLSLRCLNRCRSLRDTAVTPLFVTVASVTSVSAAAGDAGAVVLVPSVGTAAAANGIKQGCSCSLMCVVLVLI